ncbi:MAG: GTPase ObgE [Chitinophagaceae bacterium]
MEQSNFIDQIRVFCRSGNGGSGSVHFLRAKYIPFGGPDGGNGGRGGHIIVKGNENLWTLFHLRYQKNIFAKNGEKGSKNNATGAEGKDQVIEVPLGTIIYDEQERIPAVEIQYHGEEKIWMKGGRGGLGNTHFVRSTNQAPDYAQPGEVGMEGWCRVELKVLADVGLIGFPNVGKSSLLSVLTAAKPTIANYPFTTLQPQLGIVAYRDQQSFCIADLPGIIEGAAQGRGLGHQFLRHIERNSILLFIIPADSPNHKHEFEILISELQAYNSEMLKKKIIIAISKSEMLDEELKYEIAQELPENIPHIFVSSFSKEGLISLKDLLWKIL